MLCVFFVIDSTKIQRLFDLSILLPNFFSKKIQLHENQPPKNEAPPVGQGLVGQGGRNNYGHDAR